MRQLIMAGSNNALSGASNEYNGIRTGQVRTWNATETDRHGLVAIDGRLQGLYIKLATAPGAGSGWTFTLMLNGAATSITVTISGTDTTGFDLTNEVTVTAQDLISIRSSVASGVPAAGRASWSVGCWSDNDKESVLIGGTNNTLSPGAIEFNNCSGQQTWSVVTVNGVTGQLIVPANGTLKGMNVRLSADPTQGSYTFAVLINGAVSSLSVTIAGGSTSGSSANTESVSAGDTITLRYTSTTRPAPDVVSADWSFVFQNDKDYENVIMGNSDDLLNTTATEYNNIEGENQAWNATETARRVLAQNCIISDFYIESALAPGAAASGKKYTFTVMKDGVATDLVAEIIENATTGNDTTNKIYVEDFEELSLRCVPTGTPTATRVKWGMVIRPLTGTNQLRLVGYGL